MATFNLLALPPYADVQDAEKPFTIDNVCGNYIAYPYYWNTSGFNLGLNTSAGLGGDFSGQPFGATYNRASTMELFDQYKSCSEMRTFYPSASILYSPTLGLGCLNMHWFLKLLDFWHSQTNKAGNPLKMLWVPHMFNPNGANQAVWTGYNQDTAAGEQQVINFWHAFFGAWTSTTSLDISTGAKTITLPINLLLTNINLLKIYQTSNPSNFMRGEVTAYNSSTGETTINVTSIGGTGVAITDWSVKICSPLGYVTSDHPALAGVELANEAIKNTTPYAAAARAARITYKLVKFYKPDCKVIQASIANANPHWGRTLLASAASLIPVAVDGDDGTGKQYCDYIQDGISIHPYVGTSVSFATTYVDRMADIASNYFGSGRLLNDLAINEAQLSQITQINSSSSKYGTDPKSIPLHITETGPIGTIVSPSSGGWVSFMASKKEKLNNLIRYALPQMLSTRDGVGGFGKYYAYAFDTSGNSGGTSSGDTAKNGSNGTIDKLFVVKHTTGEIRVTLSSSMGIPFSANVQHQSIVITAGAGGWSDLGLAAGEKKRFTIYQVNGSTVVLEDTKYTAAPANNASYTEFQVDWSPFPEEWDDFVSLLTNGYTTGLISWGWINYPNAFRGHWFNVKGVGTWYLTSTGEVRRWDKAA